MRTTKRSMPPSCRGPRPTSPSRAGAGSWREPSRPCGGARRSWLRRARAQRGAACASVPDQRGSVAELTAVRPVKPPLDLTEAARLPSGAVLERLGVTPAGLSTPQADERLRTVGPNVLVAHKVTALGVLLRQLRNPL